VLLHDRKEFHNDFGAWSDHDLTLSGFFGIVDGVETVIEDRSAHHFVGVMRFSMADYCDRGIYGAIN
jgi:hypothetical protein